tara:strand:- start:41 stop:319 length:279 start_codon:yes stop_codon:yes gene_type:complete
MASKTSKYYKKNPKAAAKRRKQQARYNKSPKGLSIRVNANKLNRKLGTYGNRDGGWMPPIIRVVKPVAENKNHLLTEEADLKLEDDPITTNT